MAGDVGRRKDAAMPRSAQTIAQRSISDLIPCAANARTHGDAQIALIAGSIREYGFNNPVLVDGTNGIIAGHGRVLAARKLGLTAVPTIELGHLSEAQKRAYVLADNRLAEQAGWDRELLALELADLSELGMMGGRGVDALLNHGQPDPREEETPETPVVPVSRAGDLWLLGKHRLLRGDATDAAAVERLLDGVVPHLCVYLAARVDFLGLHVEAEPLLQGTGDGTSDRMLPPSTRAIMA